jgi:hypothetical protein
MAQFGSEKNSHDLALNAARTSVNMLAVPPGSFPIALTESAPPQSVDAPHALALLRARRQRPPYRRPAE